MLLPVLTKAKIRAQRAACTANLGQLGMAWQMYYQENLDRLAESYPVNNTNAWILGDMRNPAQAQNPDLIRAGKLFAYNRDVALYHCPTDPGVTVNGKKWTTVRSYSMNSFMGARDPALGPIPVTAGGYVPFFSRASDLRRPSSLWVLLDEDERSINDGFFVTDPTARVWYDFPASTARRHDHSYALNFADGHSEIYRERDPRSSALSFNQTEQAANHDLQRLAAVSTVPK